jgi:hypothetical protein
VTPAVLERLRADGLSFEPERPSVATPDELSAARCVVSFGPELAGVDALRWDEVPAVADGIDATVAAIEARLPELLAHLDR